MEIETKQVDKYTVRRMSVGDKFKQVKIMEFVGRYVEKHAEEQGIDFKSLSKRLTADPMAYESLTDEEWDFITLNERLKAYCVVAPCVKPFIKIDEWLAMDMPMLNELADTVNNFNAVDKPPAKKKRKRKKT